jgi:hypothetical protein
MEDHLATELIGFIMKMSIQHSDQIPQLPEADRLNYFASANVISGFQKFGENIFYSGNFV